VNTAPGLRRRLFAFAIVVSPLVVLACSQAESHPGLIGDCSGANCPPGQGQSVPSGSGSASDAAIDTGTDTGVIVTDSGSTDAGTD